MSIISGIREEPDLLRAIATGMRPRARVRPSEWVRDNIVLKPERTARPGPMDPNWKPWGKLILDLCYEHPEKRGLIALKRAQCGFTTTSIALMLCLAATDPGPMLYLTTDQLKALEFANDLFGPMAASTPALTKLFADEAKVRRELGGHRPFPGGFIDFAWAGSESSVISTPRRYIILDEYQRSAENFPAASGDLWTTAQARTETYSDNSLVLAFSHPRWEGEDISALYMLESDQGRCLFDCPKCGTGIAPEWEAMVRYKSADAEGVRDWESARMHCPHCDKEINDYERAASIRATFRRESPLSESEARKRPFLGLTIHAFCDPEVPFARLARDWASCDSNEKRQSFKNKVLGETDKRSRGVLGEEQISAAISTTERIVVPGGPLGAHFMVIGADVQAPRLNPTIYISAGVYTVSGMLYIVALERVSGFAAYHNFLRNFTVQVDQPSPLAAAMEGRMWVRAAGIDTRFETGQVMDNSRLAVYTSHGGALVLQVPVAHAPQLNADQPALMAPERKRINPQRPELGAIDYFYLHRHSWVDRLIRRFGEGRIKILCREPEGLRGHLTANALRPAPKVHGQASEQMVWTKPDDYRDDWLQAMVYHEAVAALKLKLDSIHALAIEGQVVEQVNAPSGHVEQGHESRWKNGGESPRGRGWMGDYQRRGWIDRGRR